MISQKKSIELQQYYSIVQATLDYNIERLGGILVYDNEDTVSDYYRQQKIQTEKYFQQRRLDKIQQKLATLAKAIIGNADIYYASYIRDKTGYSIDIFEENRKIADRVLAQDCIENREEYEVVNIMLRFYRQMPDTDNIVSQLEQLQLSYLEKKAVGLAGTNEQIKSTITEVDGILTTDVTIYEGSKRPDNEQIIMSPDGQRRLYVQSGHNSHAAASITIEFPSASGAIFWAQGIHQIEACWKDNSTINITIPTNCQPTTQCKQVQNFDDKVSIEYEVAE